jgi:hypothetical protein
MMPACNTKIPVELILLFMIHFRHNLNDDVRLSLYDALNEWTTALGKDEKYMGGDQPSLGDLVRISQIFYHRDENGQSK